MESARSPPVTAVIRDIGAGQAAEKRLARMEGEYRGLLEAAPDAMAVVNQGGEIVLLNLQAEMKFGYRHDELVGQKVTNIIPKGFAERLPADGLTEIELTGRRKDGSEFPIELMLSPLESAEGILVTAAIRDISVRKDAEQHLAQMEGRYRGLLEAAPDAMVVVNQGGEIVLLNIQAEKQFGYRRDELLGQKVTNIIPEGFAERLIADGTRTAEDALAQQIGTGIELTGRRKDGSEFPIELMLSPLESADGILVTAAIRDISVRRYSEFSNDLSESTDRRQTEEKYRTLCNSIDEGYCTIEMLFDQSNKPIDYRFLEINSSFKKQTGIQNALGKRMLEIAPLHEKHWFEIYGKIASTGEPARFEQFAAQLHRWFDVYAFRVGKPHERKVSVLFSDITARKRAEEALRESEGKYRGLLEAAPDAMVVVNQGGEIVLLNLQAEKQFGYRRDELLGQKVTNIIPKGFAERLIADGARTAAETVAQQIGTGIELTGRRKDGDEFPIELMLSPLESADGILVTAAIRDISVRKNTEKHLARTERRSVELARSNDDLQQFAYIAAHDLQEPLRMVTSYTQLLARRYKGRLDSDADEFIAYAVDGAHRMQLLIRDLLTYCRMGTAGMELRETSSEAALEQALINLRGAIEESGGLVTHDPLPSVIADGAQLVQLFQNVVGNAIKYRGAELPRVHVSAKKNGANEWIFSMRDNGLGIDPRYFEKIFVMFQRLHSREEFSGTGIGLTLCKKIAERHGGRMWVESDPGKGSTFYFALPERGMK